MLYNILASLIGRNPLLARLTMDDVIPLGDAT